MGSKAVAVGGGVVALGVAGAILAGALAVRPSSEAPTPPAEQLYRLRVAVPGASLDDLERDVVGPLENMLLAGLGVQEWVAVSREGEVILTLRPHERDVADYRLGFDVEREAVGGPGEVQAWELELRPVREPARVVLLGGEATTLEEASARGRALRERLVQAPGVRQVALLGEADAVLRVRCDPERLVACGLTAHDVAAALRAGLAGAVEAEALTEVVLALRDGVPLRLGDVGEVRRELRGRTRVYLEGQPVVAAVVFGEASGLEPLLAEEPLAREFARLEVEHGRWGSWPVRGGEAVSLQGPALAATPPARGLWVVGGSLLGGPGDPEDGEAWSVDGPGAVAALQGVPGLQAAPLDARGWVVLTHEERGALDRAVDALEAGAGELPEVRGLLRVAPRTAAEARVRWDPEALEALGWTPVAADAALRSARELEVVAGVELELAEDLTQLRLSPPIGGEVPLSALGQVSLDAEERVRARAGGAPAACLRVALDGSADGLRALGDRLCVEFPGLGVRFVD